MDFLRFAVFVNGECHHIMFVNFYICGVCNSLKPPHLPLTGESVEENANVVVRLLIRRPECFGPALRGEGGNGLLAAMEDAIKISEDPARDGPTVKKDRRFM